MKFIIIRDGVMLKSLQGKSAVITGSTSGIGLAIADYLASQGVNIMLNGFGDAQAIEELQKNLMANYDVKVSYSSADLTKVEQIQAMIVQAHNDFDCIDILVNNAGVQHVCPIEDFPTEKWDQIIALNLTAAFHTIKTVVPLMLSSGWGRIVNIASAHGLVASPFKSAYVAAKHGLVGLTKTAALEFAERNITVNAICPGYVRTPLVDKQVAEQAKAHNIPEERVIRDVILQTQPNKKFIQAQHLAELVGFVCSDAGESMTGEIISIDGGWTAH